MPTRELELHVSISAITAKVSGVIGKPHQLSVLSQSQQSVSKVLKPNIMTLALHVLTPRNDLQCS